VEKATGSEVFAGSINQSGALDVQASSVGRDTAYGKIVEAVERAEHSRAPVQRTADRFAGYLVYFALACALLTFLLSRDVRATISVIIVAGACGIAAGTPLAILGAIGRAARDGAIIKGGIHLETLWRLDTVVLDKTGTLTLGQPKVVEMDPAAGVSLRQLVEAAAIAESPSEHPLGKAIVQKAKQLGYSVMAPEYFDYTPGRGVFCLSNGREIMAGSQSFLRERGISNHFGTYEGAATEIFVGQDRAFLGALRIRDTIRAESAGAISELKKMGLKTVLLTGDAPAVTSGVARELKIDQFHAGLLPHEKVTKVRELQAHGKTVAMVGDGINDAPALVEASVGVAMGSGADVARESADIVLIGNDLLRFVHTIGIARRCRGIILFNFVGTLAVDSVGVGLAAFGLLNPLLAALIHVVSELAFIGNSARMLPGHVKAAHRQK
jgi:Cd2+/Zn2+-exporting ATPase/Cu+-exporting ATPase